MFFRQPLTVAAGLCLLLAACGGDAALDWGGTVADSAGVRIVTNPVEGLWTQESRWTVTEELRIGELAGDPEYQFGQISGVDIDAAGNIYAVDMQAQEARAFDPNGNYLFTMGGPGAGPGEIGAAAQGIFVGADRRVRIADLANGRVNFYTDAGEPDGSFNLPVAEGGIPVRWKMSPEGVLMGQIMQVPVQGADLPEGGQRYPIVAYNDDGSIADTVHTLPPGGSMQTSGGQTRVKLFSPEPVWDRTLDGRFVSAYNSAYRVEFFDHAGNLTQVLNRESTRLPLTEEHKDEMLRLLANVMVEQGLPEAAVPRVLASFDFADYYPAFLDLRVADDGSVWLQHIRTADDFVESGRFDPQALGGNEWDVFDAEGRYLGELVFPDGFSVFRIDGDLVYGVIRDELDVPYISRMRVNRPST